jgi:hypothetical protein
VVEGLACGGGALGIEELRPGAAPTAGGLLRPAVSGTASMLAEHRRGIDKERICDEGRCGRGCTCTGTARLGQRCPRCEGKEICSEELLERNRQSKELLGG